MLIIRRRWIHEIIQPFAPHLKNCRAGWSIGSYDGRGIRRRSQSLYDPGARPGTKTLIDAYTKAKGVKVNTIFVKDGLAERVEAEGDKSPADVLMTVDIGNLD